jgi:hypothetical protein
VPSIREYVELNLPESYLVVTSEAKRPLDGKDGRPDVVGMAVKLSVEQLLASGKKEKDVTSEFAKAFIADVASRRIIITLINYHMERTGRSDSVGPPGRGNPLALNETRQHYDRVQTLQQLDAMLAARIAANMGLFQSIIGTVVGGAPTARGPMISSWGQRLRTQNPLDMPTVRDLPAWLPLPFGVGYPTWGDIGLPWWGDEDESLVGDPAEPFELSPPQVVE